MSKPKRVRARKSRAKAKRVTPLPPINLAPDLDLLNKRQACQVIGGNGAPIDPSTLWRGVKAGRYPKPIPISSGIVRWSRAELEASLRKMVEARG